MAEDPFSLRDAVCLVVGGTGGIGSAVVRQLVEDGAEVVVADRSVSEHDAGDGAAAGALLEVDVCDEASCVRLIDEVLRRRGRLDVVVNAFGVNARAASHEVPIAEWNRLLDVNLTGVLRVSQAAYPALRRSDRAAIVNLASTAGQVAIRDNAHYSVSKAGIMHLTKVLANDWAGQGIRVNAVGPTIVPTAMTEEVRSDPTYMAAKLATIPLGRMVTADEVAHAVRFLASSGAAMITGQTLFVDGGVTLL